MEFWLRLAVNSWVEELVRADWLPIWKRVLNVAKFIPSNLARIGYIFVTESPITATVSLALIASGIAISARRRIGDDHKVASESDQDV